MVRKKVDNRIRVLIENGVHTGHRSIFAIVGDKGRDQVKCYIIMMKGT
jgi:N-acetyltransferase 10